VSASTRPIRPHSDYGAVRRDTDESPTRATTTSCLEQLFPIGLGSVQNLVSHDCVHFMSGCIIFSACRVRMCVIVCFSYVVHYHNSSFVQLIVLRYVFNLYLSVAVMGNTAAPLSLYYFAPFALAPYGIRSPFPNLTLVVRPRNLGVLFSLAFYLDQENAFRLSSSLISAYAPPRSQLSRVQIPSLVNYLPNYCDAID
ncbi:unnamed protein product, partial [Strongylus vulgaris]